MTIISSYCGFTNEWKVNWLLYQHGILQTLGEDVKSIFVDELGATISRHEMFNYIVHDPMAIVIEVDWRDFFPYLKWIPNRGFENKIEQINNHKMEVGNLICTDYWSNKTLTLLIYNNNRLSPVSQAIKFSTILK